MQFQPILASNVLPLVVRGLVALWLQCPHLLTDTRFHRTMLHPNPGRHGHTHTDVGILHAVKGGAHTVTEAITFCMTSHPDVQGTQIYRHTMWQTLAAGMVCLYAANTPTSSCLLTSADRSQEPPLPSLQQNPGITFLTRHYLHHLHCSHLPSNLEWSHLWVTWLITLRSKTCWHNIAIYLCRILLRVLPQVA